MRDFQIGALSGAALRVLAVLIAGLVLAGCGDGQAESQGQQKHPPTPVDVVSVKPRTVPVYAEYPGRVQGKQTAQVIGRVTGVLESKNFTEGSLVHKGDLLFKIDSRTYQAEVDQRKAELASAKSAQANSARVWKRTRDLYKSNAVSQAERDQALSSYQSDKASVQVAKANLESAKISLDYTTVQAPLTGVTSLRDVDLGSLIVADQTRLTTITQLSPVYVLFALPESDAFARRKALHEMGRKSSDEATREATIILSDGEPFPHKGEVDFTQSTIDPDTGTVQLRALVENPGNRLMPGSYVRVSIRLQTLHDAIVVPEKAIVSGQQTQVYLAKDGKAQTQKVELGPLTSAGRVITQGLSAGDEVITSGLGSLMPGAAVKPQQQKDDKSSKGDDSGAEQASGASQDN